MGECQGQETGNERKEPRLGMKGRSLGMRGRSPD